MTYEFETATCKVNFWHEPLVMHKAITPDNFLTLQDVLNAGCEAFNVTRLQLISKDRKKELVRARYVTMYVMRLKVKVRNKRDKLKEISLKAIGRLFNRDHTTVLHGIDVIDDDLSVPAYRQETNELINSVIKYL